MKQSGSNAVVPGNNAGMRRGGTNIRCGVVETRQKKAADLSKAAGLEIGTHDTAVPMHNDGVVQGLSEIPFMQDFKRWEILTIGTGLGNARFTNRTVKKKD